MLCAFSKVKLKERTMTILSRKSVDSNQILGQIYA